MERPARHEGNRAESCRLLTTGGLIGVGRRPLFFPGANEKVLLFTCRGRRSARVEAEMEVNSNRAVHYVVPIDNGGLVLPATQRPCDRVIEYTRGF